MTLSINASSSTPPDPDGLDRLLAVLRQRRASSQGTTARLVASVVVSLDDPGCAEIDVMAADVSVPEEVIARAEAVWVRALAAQLPQPYREVIHWRFGLDGGALTVREVATLLRCGVATAYKIEQDGLRILREAQPLAGKAAQLRRRLRRL